MEYLALTLGLLLLGFFAGRTMEGRHYAEIRKREHESLPIPVVSFGHVPSSRPVRRATLATGSVVVSVDYYKRFLAGLRGFFGGELGSYASLIDRGRREAVLRMRESAPRADMFVNCRIETFSVFSGTNDSAGSISIEVFAYSTAIEFEPDGAGLPASRA